MTTHRIYVTSMARPGAPHGYGVISHRIRQHLGALDTVHVVNDDTASIVDDWDFLILISQPFPWLFDPHSNKPRRDLIWHTMFEVFPLPPKWPQWLNRSRAVWVPSEWCRGLFEDNGVTVPIMVIPYGIDHDLFYPTERRGRDGPMKFVAWGRGLISRKFLLLVVKAFLRADIKDAILEVKVNADDDVGCHLPTFTWDGKVVSEDRVRLICADWTRRQVADWLRSADVGIYLSGGEGFGLMPLEMMATGLPVILQVNTGIEEYATDDNCIPIRLQRAEPAFTYRRRFGYECWWYKPDEDVVVEAIRWAYENRERTYEIGVRGHQTARRFTWQRMATELASALDVLEGGI